jgi:hypothetical protein
MCPVQHYPSFAWCALFWYGFSGWCQKKSLTCICAPPILVKVDVKIWETYPLWFTLVRKMPLKKFIEQNLISSPTQNPVKDANSSKELCLHCFPWGVFLLHNRFRTLLHSPGFPGRCDALLKVLGACWKILHLEGRWKKHWRRTKPDELTNK